VDSPSGKPYYLARSATQQKRRKKKKKKRLKKRWRVGAYHQRSFQPLGCSSFLIQSSVTTRGQLSTGPIITRSCTSRACSPSLLVTSHPAGPLPSLIDSWVCKNYLPPACLWCSDQRCRSALDTRCGIEGRIAAPTRLSLAFTTGHIAGTTFRPGAGRYLLKNSVESAMDHSKWCSRPTEDHWVATV
jgi:hypothetical protein